MGPPPVVTGISPKEGPPGTRVTIRGECLGNKPGDLIGLSICGIDCLLSADWKSSTKVVVRTGGGKGRGPIVVTTNSGGVGTCLVEFRGYVESVGPLKECAVWPESEAPSARMVSTTPTSATSALLHEDPLGLSVESEEGKLRADELEELFPGCDGEISSDKFSPGWFLLENHLGTSFDDLNSGLHYLRRKVQSHKQGHLSFLKGNVGSVMEQLDTLDNLRTAFNKDVQELGTNNRTLKLEEAIKGCIAQSGEMFEGVLQGREIAEKTRASLALLTRYKYLLTLPTTLDNARAAADYDAVVTDYTRANNLFSKTEVKLFKRVLEEVENKMTEFKASLMEQLQVMPNSIENQRKIVRCLNQLEAKDDVGFILVQTHYTYIMQSIKQRAKVGGGIPIAMSLLNCVNELLPSAWTLTQQYLAADLVPKPNPEYKMLLKVGLVNECLSAMSQSVLDAVKGSTLNDSTGSMNANNVNGSVIGSVLSHALSILASIRQLPNMSEQALEPFLFLTDQLRLLTIQGTLKAICEQAKNLGSREEWNIEYDKKYGSITQLGDLFSSLLSDTVSLLKDCGLPTNCSSLVIDELVKLITDIFNAFFESTEELVGPPPESDVILSQVMCAPTKQSKHGHSVPDWEERIVVCISNCCFVRECVAVQWANKVSSRGGELAVLGKRVLHSAQTGALQLESQLMSAYLDAKTDPLVGTIEPSMYIGHYDWDTDIPIRDISPYAKEIIANVTVILAQMEEGCNKLKDKVMPTLVESVAEEVSRLFLCVGCQYSRHGAMQAHLDLTALAFAVAPFTTNQTQKYFNEALESLPDLKKEERALVKELFEECKTRMHMQLSLVTSL